MIFIRANVVLIAEREKRELSQGTDKFRRINMKEILLVYEAYKFQRKALIFFVIKNT